MEENLQNVADAAADKLAAEKAEAIDAGALNDACKRFVASKKLPVNNKNVLDACVLMRSSLIDEVARTLTRFCYQNEEFAGEILKCEKKLADAIDSMMEKIGPDKPSLSDVEAYAAAVQFYIPSAKVTVSFRLNIPSEIDEDLFGLGDADEGGQGASHAIILDLFENDEEEG